MNIITVKPEGSFCFRPDSTLNHKFADYYCPDAVASLQVIPVIYTRVTKAGKCVAERFAQRYFDSFAFGCLINDTTDGVSTAMATSLDATSVLGMDFRPVDLLSQSSFALEVNGQTVFCMTGVPDVDQFAKAVAAVTARSMLRLGDIIALELCDAKAIARGDELSLVCDNASHSLKIL